MFCLTRKMQKQDGLNAGSWATIFIMQRFDDPGISALCVHGGQAKKASGYANVGVCCSTQSIESLQAKVSKTCCSVVLLSKFKECSSQISKFEMGNQHGSGMQAGSAAILTWGDSSHGMNQQKYHQR